MSQSKKIEDWLYEDTMRGSEQHPYSTSSSSTQSSTRYSIYKVPGTIRDLNKRAYSPRIVSIGLIHALDQCVEPMKEHKESYMYALFHRTAKPGESDVSETIKLCVNAMALEADRARKCYPQSVFEVDPFYGKDVFGNTCSDKWLITTARIMLVDGCFLLELLMRSWSIKQNRTKPGDPIIGDNLKVRDVKHDLLLLENQIPFFILELLFEHTVERIQNRPVGSLTHLILEFFGNMMNSKFELKIKDGENEKADHILGLLHSCYRPDASVPGDYAIRKYSATELHRSGVNFKPSKRDDYIYLHVDFQTPCLVSRCFFFSLIKGLFSRLLDITRTIFKTLSCSSTAQKMMLLNKLPVSVSKAEPTENPVSASVSASASASASVSVSVSVSEPNPVGKHKCCLFSCLCQLCCRATREIPQLCINDLTEPFLRNLIAFEQCSQNTPRHITSYAFLMDTLINSEEHVELLEREEVLQNYLGTGEDASDLFNNLCKEVILGEFYFSKQWEQVDDYCNLYWPSRIASMRRTYFSSPWTGISVVAALILFAFTGIQTICSLILL